MPVLSLTWKVRLCVPLWAPSVREPLKGPMMGGVESLRVTVASYMDAHARWMLAPLVHPPVGHCTPTNNW
jgi:hypothetical protein